MRPDKLLRRIRAGSYSNVAFRDACRLAESFGFEEVRVSGSHHFFRHPDAGILLNLQDVDGQAKPYQLRQFVKMIQEYALEVRRHP